MAVMTNSSNNENNSASDLAESVEKNHEDKTTDKTTVPYHHHGSDSDAKTTAADDAQDINSNNTETLPRRADRIPKEAWLVMLLTMAERFAFYGMTTPFMNFMQNARRDDHEGLRPGALGWGQERASRISNLFNVLSWLTPMLSGLAADRWLGRYRALCVTFAVYVIGATMLLLSSIEASSSNRSGSRAAEGLFMTALVLIALGMSGANGLMAAFVGDQYVKPDGSLVVVKKGKGNDSREERFVADRALTLQAIYSYYYWAINVGGLAGIATTALELHVGFWAAFLLPLCSLSVAAAVLVLARRRLVIVVPVAAAGERAAISHTARALWLAARDGRFSLDGARPHYQLAHHGRHVPWTDDFIDGLRSGLHACRMVFAAWPVLHLCRGQMNNNLMAQAGQMDTGGVPNDMLYNANPVIIVICIPLFNHFLFPWLLRRSESRGRTAALASPVIRLVAGFVLEALAMGMASVVQKLIYDAPPCYRHPLRCAASDAGRVPNAVSVAVQLPVYLFEAWSEMLSSPAGWELIFSMAPDGLKSTMQSIYATTGAFGAVLSIAISPFYKDPDMLWVWSSLSIVMGVVTLVFYIIWGRQRD